MNYSVHAFLHCSLHLHHKCSGLLQDWNRCFIMIKDCIATALTTSMLSKEWRICFSLATCKIVKLYWFIHVFQRVRISCPGGLNAGLFPYEKSSSKFANTCLLKRNPCLNTSHFARRIYFQNRVKFLSISAFNKINFYNKGFISVAILGAVWTNCLYIPSAGTGNLRIDYAYV